jgi:glucose-6-phosphate dehydrogenase assembly protein OpcA
VAEAVSVVSRSEYRAMLDGEARPVEVSAIEHELGQLWNAAREDTPDGQPLVRSCVLNLVVYVTSDEEAGHAGEVVAQTAGRHPSRAIIVVAEPGGESRLEASMAAHCQVSPEGGRRVCAEQVTLRAGGRALEELNGSVLPLIVSDLPVFLWWQDLPDAYSHLLHELLETCDRLVVDSADYPSDRAGAALADLRRLSTSHNVGLGDLNWTRLTHWREFLAQFFDGPPGRDYLERLSRVEVEIASVHGQEADLTEGLLLVGWLASRLQWHVPDDDHIGEAGPLDNGLIGPAGTVTVDMKPDPGHPGEGLQSVRLLAGDEARFEVSRKAEDEACVAISAETPEGSYSRVVHMDPPPDAALLSEELDRLEHDAVFEEALAQAVRFMGGRA